jgi:hypothetical protein
VTGERGPFEEDRFGLELEGRYTRLQVDGGDLASVEDHGDGIAFVTVYDSSAPDGNVVWAGSVAIPPREEWKVQS